MTISDTVLKGLIEELELVDPTAEVALRREPAPRLSDLNGKRGCYLENSMENSRVVLEQVKEMLEKQYNLADSQIVSKLWYSRPADADLLEDIAGNYDFVISGIGV